jgi:hypothetical protein
MMTKEQILELRPRFDYNGMFMVDWFEIKYAGDAVYICNGLRHADPEIKSPYYYDEYFYGKDAEEKAIEHFYKWYNSLK